MVNKTVLITGATSGIGQATAYKLAATHRLILCGRRQTRLDSLAAELATQTEVHTLCFDIRDNNAVVNAVHSLPDRWQQIDVLINNAGLARGIAPIHEGVLQDWEAMIDTNVKGLLYISRAIIPRMVQAKAGHIINIGSIAGKEVYPGGNVYNASKFAVDALNRAMKMDLNAYGIRVCAINPGLVETEFSEVRFNGDTTRAKQVYTGITPLSGHDIADSIAFVLAQPAHINISDLTILPTCQASATLVKRELAS
jgi:3-hydroxy acid dehydrogenase / malonic semialdehyde reductase